MQIELIGYFVVSDIKFYMIYQSLHILIYFHFKCHSTKSFSTCVYSSTVILQLFMIRYGQIYSILCNVEMNMLECNFYRYKLIMHYIIYYR